MTGSLTIAKKTKVRILNDYQSEPNTPNLSQIWLNRYVASQLSPSFGARTPLGRLPLTLIGLANIRKRPFFASG